MHTLETYSQHIAREIRKNFSGNVCEERDRFRETEKLESLWELKVRDSSGVIK